MQLRPIGWFHKTTARNLGVKIFRSLFGIEDYHTHLRWNGIKQFLDSKAYEVLEVGANSGIMTFHFSNLNPAANFMASEYDADAISEGLAVQKHYKQFKNVQFSSQDLREFKSDSKFDQILLIDVLEHIKDDSILLSALGKTLKENGTLLISVPTPRYPIVFGRDFHNSIGHVRDGYTIDHLSDTLDTAGFRILGTRLHTNVFNSFFCSLFYKIKFPGRLKWLLMTFLIPMVSVSESIQGKNSAGLVVLAERLA